MPLKILSWRTFEGLLPSRLSMSLMNLRLPPASHLDDRFPSEPIFFTPTILNRVKYSGATNANANCFPVTRNNYTGWGSVCFEDEKIAISDCCLESLIGPLLYTYPWTPVLTAREPARCSRHPLLAVIKR